MILPILKSIAIDVAAVVVAAVVAVVVAGLKGLIE